MSMSPLFGSALKRRKTSPAVECSRRKFVLFDHSTPSTSNSVTNSHSHSRTDSHTVALSDRVTECERIITRQVRISKISSVYVGFETRSRTF